MGVSVVFFQIQLSLVTILKGNKKISAEIEMQSHQNVKCDTRISEDTSLLKEQHFDKKKKKKTFTKPIKPVT